MLSFNNIADYSIWNLTPWNSVLIQCYTIYLISPFNSSTHGTCNIHSGISLQRFLKVLRGSSLVLGSFGEQSVWMLLFPSWFKITLLQIPSFTSYRPINLTKRDVSFGIKYIHWILLPVAVFYFYYQFCVDLLFPNMENS